MRSGGRIGRNVPGRVMAFSVAVLMTSGVVLALTPFIGPTIVAPPTAGTLGVGFYDIAPDTHTFPGDENVTMIWLEMTASGGDVQVNSLNFTMGGNFSGGEVSSVALLDGSRNCELTNITNPTGSFTLPTAGNLNECAPPFGSYIVLQSQTRYIRVFVSVSPTATEGNMISINLDAISTDGSVVGDSGASGVIEILHIFFSDDMESGQGSWTTTGGDDGGQFPNGLWHQSSGEFTCKNNFLGKKFYHSYNSSWWYGHRYEDPYFPGEYFCAYYTWDPSDYLLPTRNWGELTTPDVDAVKGQSLYLSFRHMLFGEPDTPVIKPDNGHLRLFDGSWHNITPFTDGYDSTDNGWWKEKVNLSAYAGSQVKLEFGFDTVDEENNLWMGWFVDDVTVYGKMVKHALAVNNNDVPPLLTLPEDGSPVMYSISAQINNIGASDEFDIVVNLTVNGTTVNQTMIGVLGSGTNSAILLGWLVKAEGVYEVCIEATAASGASSRACRTVTVIIVHITNVAVLRSFGTRYVWIRDTWNHLNSNSWNYGSTPVDINYTSLDINPITYDAINATGADVLLISGSGHYAGMPPPADMEFSDNETAAIERYVNEGHGLVTIGTTFDFRIPNNNDLVGLVGIKDQAYYQDVVYDMQVDPACASHPVFQNVSTLFHPSFNGTMTPADDHSWDLSDLNGGRFCAMSPGNVSTIVLSKGSVMMSFGADVAPNRDGMQLLYNAMVWSERNLAPPKNLWIHKSGSMLRLDWEESGSSDVQGYRIYRSPTVNGFDFLSVYDTAPAGATQWLDPQADAGTDANNYFYILRAFDDQGDEENNTNKVGKFVNQLHIGTNDISIGFEMSDNATSVVFESVDGLYEKVETLHALRCRWIEWTSSGGLLPEVDRSMGLRVTMISEGALVTVGRVVDTTIDLVDTCGGWNFVGYPSFESASTPVALDGGGLAGTYDVVFEYDPLDRMNPWKFFSSNDTSGSALVDLNSGMGIWIHVIQAGVWEVEDDP